MARKKNHDQSWSKHWDNVDFHLLAVIRLKRAYSQSLVRYNLPHLVKVIEHRHNTDKRDL